MPAASLNPTGTNQPGPSRPLADRMRPKSLSEFIGQQAVVGPRTALATAMAADRLFSMILWGPPGCGKTTLAHIMASETRAHFVAFSAVLSGVKDIRAVIEVARIQQTEHGRRTLLFVDEIHRFNKSQQDAFLHHVESGLITLVGATTENPSFEVIPALLSRCRVFVLEPLSEADLTQIVHNALNDTGVGIAQLGLTVGDDMIEHLVQNADGDARRALNGLELAADLLLETGQRKFDVAQLAKALQQRTLQYDKAGEQHYNLISALHKSLRDSDPDAALYWLGRMLAAGEDPLYIARRMVRFASEDVGNADPNALTMAVNGVSTYHFLGSPEGELALFQVAAYLATAPKSNRIYSAQHQVYQTIKATGSLPVPLHLRNAPTPLMRNLGYGREYRYAHNYKEALVEQDHLPKPLAGKRFYNPVDRGYEQVIKKRLARWQRLRRQRKHHTDNHSS